MLTHLLDTSAWLVHLQREPGWETVSRLLADDEAQVGIAAISLVELHGRLRSVGREGEFAAIIDDYRDLFDLIAPLTETTALRAIELRQSAASRIPTIDATIAATAAQHDAVLVHRDAHFRAIPVEQVRQRWLGEEGPTLTKD